MTPGPEPAPAPSSASAPDAAQAYTVRRAPRLSAVLTLSALGGLLAALLVSVARHASPEPQVDPYSGEPVTFASTFGYLSLAFLLGALVLGLLVWLLLDRRSRSRERTVLLEPTDDPREADVTLDRHEAQALRERTSAPAAAADAAPGPTSPDTPSERTTLP